MKSSLAKGQSPDVLWIGCSDSRVPVETITGMQPGRVFVHRNVANLMKSDDPSGTSCLVFAVEELKVSHIVVCGHTQCGGVKAAMAESETPGVVGRWVSGIRALYKRSVRGGALSSRMSESERYFELTKLNVSEQVRNVRLAPAVAQAKHEVRVHGMLYDVGTGILTDLNVADGSSEMAMGRL